MAPHHCNKTTPDDVFSAGRCSGLPWGFAAYLGLNHKKRAPIVSILYLWPAGPTKSGSPVWHRCHRVQSSQPIAVGPQWPSPRRGARPQNVRSMVWCWPQTRGPLVVLATNRWSIGGGIEQCRQAAEATGTQLRRLQVFPSSPKDQGPEWGRETKRS